MGWRDSYGALVELFPQVDTRLIKGAALEHGGDIASAVEFILNEVLVPDEKNLDVEEQLECVDCASYDLPEGDAGQQLVAVAALETNSGAELSDHREYDRARLDGSECTFPHDDCGVTSVPGTSSDSVKQNEHGVHCDSTGKTLASASLEAESRPHLVHRNQDQAKEFLAKVHQETWDKQHRSEGSGSVMVDACVGISRGADLEHKIAVEISQDEFEMPLVSNEEIGNLSSSGHDVEKEGLLGKFDGLPREAVPEVAPESVLQIPVSPLTVCKSECQESQSGVSDSMLHVAKQMKENLDGEGYVDLAVRIPEENATWNEHETFIIQESPGRKDCQDCVVGGSRSDSVHLSPSTREDEAVALIDSSDAISMLFIDKSSIIVGGIDGPDWKKVHSSSLHMACMETLDELVEQAKSDKDVLISTIQDIRALRLKTDQAENAARHAKDEAARSGLDVLSRVDEMRQILARAQEANAVHAGEIYGEKAVLATEARELRSRVIQVQAEKRKALSVLNEIKSSLQARIKDANQEQEAAEHEKVEKELLAREILAKEEAMVAKVAQESRDLDAEAEACTKLREFLIDHGSFVDSLQGEVAVLCEDAEALKKDLDGMSLSCSGGYVHMLSRTGSDIYNSVGSRSGKCNEINGEPSESSIQLESGAFASGSNLGSPSRVVSLQKSMSDKKLWSALPSLLRSLSGSQESSSSSQLARSSTASSNSASSFRSATRALVDSGAGSHLAGSPETIEKTQYPSLPASPRITQAERDLYEAQMAMFPGEMDLDYSGSHNLDIFRSEKPNGSTDDEDWHLLDPVQSRKGSSGSSCSSCTGK